MRLEDLDLSTILFDDSLAEVTSLGKLVLHLSMLGQLLAKELDLPFHVVVVLDQGLHVLRMEVQLRRQL